MFKKIFHFLILASSLMVATNLAESPKSLSTLIPENPWKVMIAVSSGDIEHAIKIEYLNGIGLSSTQPEYCMVLFESNSEYKLVAPWLGSGKIIQKHSVTELTPTIVLKNKITF
jgi:hypothetical protein